MTQGGCICEDCKRVYNDASPILDSTLYTMQYVLSTPVEKLYSFTVTDDVLRELTYFMNHYRNTYIEHHFKSLDLLKILF